MLSRGQKIVNLVKNVSKASNSTDVQQVIPLENSSIQNGIAAADSEVILNNKIEYTELLQDTTQNITNYVCNNDENQTFEHEESTVDKDDDSSDVSTLPEDIQRELQDIFNSDDSIKDPDYDPVEDEFDNDTANISQSEVIEGEEGETVSSNNRHFKIETRKMREERKIRRNFGKEYVTRKNKVIGEKNMKELRVCRNRCKEKYHDEVRLNLFKEFWEIGNYNRRAQYISDLIELKDKKTTRIRIKNDVGKQRERTGTAVYYFRINGALSLTCKGCFTRTFDITNKFIEIIMSKKRLNTSGIIALDKRGNHGNRNKISEEDKENAKQHILSIPSYESHYTRRRTSKKYLPAHYTLASLYQSYKDKNPEKYISRRLYEEIFYNLNIKIKQPKKDTCCTCDKLLMKIKMSKTEDESKNFKEELDLHHLKADEGYASKNADRNLTKCDPQKKTISFDLQQCLPTPDLQSGETFYKRQLWTYDLTVHDCDNSQAFCYLWYESLAKRGGNDIGSCIYRFLTKDLEIGVNHIIMYSDSCGGQNKNCHMTAACFVALQNSESLEIIDHKFLLPGHTHMECDIDHSLIEKKKKKFNGKIEHPHDWAQLIRQVGKKKPFIVTEMVRSNFYDFADLFRSSLTNRKVDTSGNRLNWREVRWLRYEKNNKTLLYKNSLDENENFKAISFEKRGKSNDILIPKQAYTRPVPITVEKKQHLMDLLPYISESLWEFYQNLVTANDQVDIFPDASSESDDEEI